MTTPDNSASQKTDEPTFAQKVEKTVSDMTQDDKGKWLMPEGEFSEEMQFAVMSEKRRLDTRSAYLGKTQEVSQLKAEGKALKDTLSKRTTLELTSAQVTELAELKSTDPDAWKAKLDGYEAEAQTLLATEFEELSAKAKKGSSVEQRVEILNDFTEANPGFSLNDDDVPPRISKKLESGKITFEEFLGEVHKYLSSPKVIAAQTASQEPNLSKMAGTSTPTEKALGKNDVHDYETSDIF